MGDKGVSNQDTRVPDEGIPHRYSTPRYAKSKQLLSMATTSGFGRSVLEETIHTYIYTYMRVGGENGKM